MQHNNDIKRRFSDENEKKISSLRPGIIVHTVLKCLSATRMRDTTFTRRYIILLIFTVRNTDVQYSIILLFVL